MAARLWWVRPETFQATPAALALLNAKERAQQQRFIPPAKRHEYLVTRVLVRTVLGEALGVAPQALQFVCNEWGRPALASVLMSAPIHFNVSHTDGLVVCLVSTENEVGVDTELFARAPRLLALAPEVFAPQELVELAALPIEDQAQRAVILWTLKESYIKARGMGLALPLDGFAFRFEPGQVCLDVKPALQDDGARWQFQWQRFGSHCISTAIALSSQQRQSGMKANAVDYVEFCRPG
ncbi:4'-phosphopantetheinyl transferase family protein [Propionivibrio sp.]|uniref:4'-phosphopantetheinyl transferase family protein n=1 Tax=Propionivibrio sp. TaxID=2212460 RepID=UPI003BF359C5